MAIEHVGITDPDIHEPKGVSTALAGQLYIADGAGSGSWVTLETGVSNVVQVGALADLPDEVSGVITLAASTMYLFNDLVDIGANRIEISEDSVLVGIHRELCGITSSNPGVLITGVSEDMRIQAMTLNAPSATKLIEFNGGGVSTLTLRDVKSVTHTGVIADVVDAGAFVVDYCVFVGGTDGMKLSGTCGPMLVQTASFFGYTGCAMHLDGTVFSAGPTIRECTLSGIGGADTSICGAAANANLGSTDLLARVASCNLASTTALSGITQDDSQWLYTDNDGVYDTTVLAHIWSKENTVTTTISSSNTPVIVNTDVPFTETFGQHFTTTTGGRATYDGFQEKVFIVTATLSGTCSSGTQDFTLFIAKNGTVLPEISVTRELASSVIDSTTLLGAVSMLPADYVECWVQNDSNSNNYEVKDISFLVKEA